MLESTPPGLDLAQVRSHILTVPGVLGVHDVHASRISSGLPVLTAHVVLSDECFHNGAIPQLLARLQGCVTRHFAVSIEHSTFQFEAASVKDHCGCV